MNQPVSHLDSIREDAAYAGILDGWNPAFYSKYTRSLRPESTGGRVLDVGCGVGQVVQHLCESGVDAYGVDVAPANIQRAAERTDRCRWYDGKRLPYDDGVFEVVGALNVLEHVEEPEAFIGDIVRVTAPGGRIVVSSPNFLRFLGWRDYHPRMRGLRNKWRNLSALLARRRQIQRDPDAVRFERMTPIIKDKFTPDDDAIVCTNALDMAFFLRRNGCRIERVACTDRDVPWWVDGLLNATPLRYGLFNAFVVARRL